MAQLGPSVGVVLAALLGLLELWPAASVGAAPVTLPQTLSAGGVQWSVDNSGGTSSGQPGSGRCDSSPGLTVKDASLQGLIDAFDNGLSVWVNGAIFTPGRTVDVTGSTLTAGPQPVAGANVSVQYFASSSATLRTVASFENASASPLSLSVSWVTNFGSDADTTVRRTSSGGATPTAADRWLVTSDRSDPPKTLASAHVFGGPGPIGAPPQGVATTVFDCAGTQGLLVGYTVNVPAGATRRLLFFNQVSTTSAGALAAASALATNPAPGSELLSGLAATQLGEIVNWSFAALSPTPAVIATVGLSPTLSPTLAPTIGSVPTATPLPLAVATPISTPTVVGLFTASVTAPTPVPILAVPPQPQPAIPPPVEAPVGAPLPVPVAPTAVPGAPFAPPAALPAAPLASVGDAVSASVSSGSPFAAPAVPPLPAGVLQTEVPVVPEAEPLWLLAGGLAALLAWRLRR